jgi:hypothetical protein
LTYFEDDGVVVTISDACLAKLATETTQGRNTVHRKEALTESVGGLGDQGTVAALSFYNSEIS